MPKQILRVSVLAQRRPPVTRWGNAELRASAVLPQEPAVAPNTLLTSDGGLENLVSGRARHGALFGRYKPPQGQSVVGQTLCLGGDSVGTIRPAPKWWM